MIDKALSLHLTPPEVEVLRIGLSLVVDDITKLKMVGAPARFFEPSDDAPHARNPAVEDRHAVEYIKEQKRAIERLDKKLRRRIS